MPMRPLVASVLEVLGVVAIAVAFGFWWSPWAALAVAGAGLLTFGVLLDQEPAA
jgi:hypothetical protein